MVLDARQIFFFFNDTATTEIYTLSLHDALPISEKREAAGHRRLHVGAEAQRSPRHFRRSEEHTSELQSQFQLVCRLLLEKKKDNRQPFSVPYKKKTTKSQ